MTNLAKHCELCENKVVDMMTGTTCSLTNKKPGFKNKCPDIYFGPNHIDRIKEVNLDYYQVKETKRLSILNFIVFMTLAIGIMTAGVFYARYELSHGVISTIFLVIIFAGIGVIPLAVGPVNKYRQGIQVTRKRKREMDALLSSYNTEYEIDITVTQDVHGNKDYEAQLKFTRTYYK